MKTVETINILCLKENFVHFHETFSQEIKNSNSWKPLRKALPFIQKYREYITIGRKRLYDALFSNEEFMDDLYDIVWLWMGQGRRRLKDRTIFKKIVRDTEDSLEEIKNITMEDFLEMEEETKGKTERKIVNIFETLDVTEAGCKIVSGSKTLHFLIPDLIPPIDRAFTGNFLSISDYQFSSPKDDQTKIFLYIFHKYLEILEECYSSIVCIYKNKQEYDYSVPKIIDNTIWGYCEEERRAKKGCLKTKEIERKSSGRYDYERFWHRVREEAGDKLYTEVWEITESESPHYFGRSIKNTMMGKCVLEEGDKPEYITPTIPRHIGKKGFSCRVGRSKGKKYVMFWDPSISGDGSVNKLGSEKR